MYKKVLLILLLGNLFCVVAVFSEDDYQNIGMPFSSAIEKDVEWSAYGLNYQWCVNKKLLQKMNLDENQKKELYEMHEVSKEAYNKDEEIR